MTTKEYFRLLRREVRSIAGELELELTDEEKELPQKHLLRIIDSIAEALGKESEIAEGVKQIEALLGLEASPEGSLVTRLEVVAEALAEDSSRALKDVADLIDDALLGPDADLRKRFEALRFQLTRINPSVVDSIYQEAHSSVMCA
jgi:hypothetical protein